MPQRIANVVPTDIGYGAGRETSLRPCRAGVSAHLSVQPWPCVHEAGVNRGYWIVFEGLDGSGKSTQLRRAARWLRDQGRDVVETREPTDGEYGRRIREMAKRAEPVAPETELAWFVEDRREHMRAVVRPALAMGRLVLSDRGYLSTVAYQGARGLDANAILADSVAEFGRPDLALLFEIEAESGLRRVAARGEPREPAFENLPFLERVASRFAALELPGLVRIDARGDEESIATEVAAAIGACLAAVD